MPFMLLVIEKSEEKASITDDEGRQRYDRMMRFAEDLRARDVLVAGESLGSDEASTRVRKRNGKRQILDGPFAEAKEIVGGFFLLNVATRGEAMEIADRCPAAEWSTLELREVGPCWKGAA
jgi:hypothetical protein